MCEGQGMKKKRRKIHPALIVVSFFINSLLFVTLLYDLQFTRVGFKMEVNPLISENTNVLEMKYYITYLVPLLLFIGSLYVPQQAIICSLMLFLIFGWVFLNNLEAVIDHFGTDYNCIKRFFISKESVHILFTKDVKKIFSAYVNAECRRYIIKKEV